MEEVYNIIGTYFSIEIPKYGNKVVSRHPVYCFFQLLVEVLRSTCIVRVPTMEANGFSFLLGRILTLLG